jgi:diguanylate cyclase (GGDEF)-like protein
MIPRGGSASGGKFSKAASQAKRVSQAKMVSDEKALAPHREDHGIPALSLETLHEQWWRAVEESPLPTVVVSAGSWEILGVNSSFRALLCLERDVPIGAPFFDFVPLEAWDAVEKAAEQALGGKGNSPEKIFFLHGSGSLIQCLIKARPVFFLGKQAIEFSLRSAAGDSSGITEKAASFFRDLVQIAPYLHDFDQVLERILERFARAVPFQAFALSLVEDGELARLTIYTGEDPLEEFLSQAQEEILGSLLHLGVRVQPMKLQHSLRERNWIPCVKEPHIGSRLILPIPMSGARGVHGVVGLFHPEPEAFCSEDTGLFSAFVGGIASSYLVYNSFRRLEHQSHTDPMTGLVNRRGLFKHLEMLLAMSRRESKPLSLLLADIDHFKEVNDRWGHQVGDEVLKQLAQILRYGVREMDLVARFGGEEFLIVLPGIDSATAAEIGERIRAEIASTRILIPCELVPEKPSLALCVSMSLGVGEIGASEDVDKAISRVDKALYKAKDQGRNRVYLAPAQAKG